MEPAKAAAPAMGRRNSEEPSTGACIYFSRGKILPTRPPRGAGVKTYSFSAPIEKVEGIGGAFVRVPLDVPRVFGAGRIKVHATFDGAPYDGSVVAFKRDDGGRDYVLGIRKDIRAAIGKGPGESVDVTLVCA